MDTLKASTISVLLCSFFVCVAGKLDCKMTAQGAEYRGQIGVTRTGRKCLPWKSIPWFSKHYRADDHYCRNPNNRIKPWCYWKIDPGASHAVWEYCNVPDCNCQVDGDCHDNAQCFRRTCLCKPGYHGSPDNCIKTGKLDCKSAIRGAEYRGQIGVTKTGKKCLPWKAIPWYREHYTEDDHYCRNPNNRIKPWCYWKIYPGASRAVWEYCNVPDCNSEQRKEIKRKVLYPPKGECFCIPKGTDYSGFVNVTRTGKPCQPWRLNFPHEHRSIENADKMGNYCRNPDNDYLPWCFTTNPFERWDYCLIDLCEPCLVRNKHCKKRAAMYGCLPPTL